MLKGINIDITNDPPSLDDVARFGIPAVRFPSRPSTDAYIDELHRLGVFTLCAIDEPAAGYVAAGGRCSAYQIANEVDIRGVPVEVCREELRIYRETYPGLVLVAPGLAAGDYDAGYLKAIAAALREYRYAAWAIHPYNKTPSAAASLFTAHQKVLPDMPGLYTECHPESDALRQFHKSAATAGVAGVFHHCWTDSMTLWTENLRFGLVDEHGNHKRDLGYWVFA